jgi:ribosome-associated protein
LLTYSKQPNARYPAVWPVAARYVPGWFIMGALSAPDLAKTDPMPRLEFTLTGDYVELHNLLKLMGLADSGGSAKTRVAEGEVKVNGKIELRKTCKIRAGQTVVIEDTTIKVHKPK